MTWAQAKNRITQRIKVGTDLNTVNSSHRTVLSLRSDISSARYGYNVEDGLPTVDSHQENFLAK